MTVTWIVLRWATLAKGEGRASVSPRLRGLMLSMGGRVGAGPRRGEERRVGLLCFSLTDVVQDSLSVSMQVKCPPTHDHGIPSAPPSTWKPDRADQRHPAKRRLPAVFRGRSY
jgi:hypothetical protein